MSVYMTEAEQLAAIKSWWGKYNGIITVLLTVVLLVVTGIKYWSWHTAKITEQASNAYEHMMKGVSNQDNKAVRSYANHLVKAFPKTIYADAARLTLAKLDISRAQFARAESMLRIVQQHTTIPALADVARIRLARLLILSKTYDKALQTLDTVILQSYQPIVKELKGDIYAERGNTQEAATYYQQALADIQKNGMGNLFLDMKTHALAQSMPYSTRSQDSLRG